MAAMIGYVGMACAAATFVATMCVYFTTHRVSLLLTGLYFMCVCLFFPHDVRARGRLLRYRTLSATKHVQPTVYLLGSPPLRPQPELSQQ